MKIERIDLFQIKIPLVSPFETSFGVTTERDIIIARTIADGVTGWGECVTDAEPGYAYETTQTAWHIITDFLIPALFSAPLDDPRHIPTTICQRTRPPDGQGHPRIILMGYRRATGRQEPARLYRRCARSRRCGCEHRHPSPPPRDWWSASWASARLAIRASRSRSSLVATCRMRAPCGLPFPVCPLMVDANSAYTLNDAPLFEQMEDLNLLMIEQPLGYDDIYQHSKLQRKLRTPICLDESIHSAADAQFAIEIGRMQGDQYQARARGRLDQCPLPFTTCVQRTISPSGAAGCWRRVSGAR